MEFIKNEGRVRWLLIWLLSEEKPSYRITGKYLFLAKIWIDSSE